MTESAAATETVDRRPALGLALLALTLALMVLPPAVGALVLLGLVA